MQTQQVDAIVVGAGLVGTAVAASLAKRGMCIALIDRKRPITKRDNIADSRGLALAYASRDILDDVGAWAYLSKYANPMEHIMVVEGARHENALPSPFFLHCNSNEVHRDGKIEGPFGWLVEAENIRAEMARVAHDTKGIMLQAPACISAITRTIDGVCVCIEDDAGKQTQWQAPLLIGADGRDSTVVCDAGICVTKKDYAQTAMVFNVAHEKPHNNTAWEIFFSAGPFAILPLIPNHAGNRSCIVWVEKHETADAMMTLPDDDYLFEVRKRFGDFLGALQLSAKRYSYPLSMQYTERLTDTRLALVGDATHVMHPIAGQGLNMGLRDAVALRDGILRARRLGLDWGSRSVLTDYERARRFDNTAMLMMTDCTNALFSNDIASLRVARDVGMAVLGRIPPLKRLFMRHAMGIGLRG